MNLVKATKPAETPRAQSYPTEAPASVFYLTTKNNVWKLLKFCERSPSHFETIEQL